MFDLFRSRDKAVRYMVGGILGIVALSMITYLIPNYQDSTTTAQNPVLFEVGSEKVTVADAQTLFNQNAQGKLPPELMEVYFPQFVDQMLSIKAAIYQAKLMGITATDDEVRSAMMTNFSQFMQNGKFQREAFESTLAAQGKTLQQAIDEMRDNILLEKMQKVVVENIVVTPQEAEAEYKKKNEKASVQYMSFAAEDFRKDVTVSEDDLKKRFETTKDSYKRPEKYGYRVLVLDQAKIEAGLTVTEGEVRAAYSSALDNFRRPERIHARHILLATEGKTDAEKAAQKTKAENLLKQARGGADFAALAKANSDDSANAPNGGDLGWATRGTYDPAFETAIFATKPKDFADLVTTPYGYHVVQVLEKEPASVAPFESVKAAVEKDLKAQKLAEKMQIAGDQLHAELVKTPAAIDTLAKKYGADIITVTDGAPSDPIPTLGVTPEIATQLQTLKPGGVTDLISLPGDRQAIAVLEAKIPGRPATLDEVRAQIKDELVTQKAEAMANEKAKAAGERLKNGEAMETVAKSLGVKLETSSTFNRADTVQGLGPAVYLEDAFTKPKGAVIGPTMLQGKQVIVKTLGKIDPDMATFAVQRVDLVNSIKQAKQKERTDMWLDSVLAKLTSDGKVVRHQDEIQRVMASYHVTPTR